MSAARDELIDFLLGELPPEEARAVEGRLGADKAQAAQLERYREALRAIRAAAAEGWAAPARRVRLLRPALAAAAVLAIAFAIFFANGGSAGPRAIYDPDGSFGYLRAEEVASDGSVYSASTVAQCTLRSGAVEVSALGSDESWALEPGQVILPDTEISSTADEGVRIDLPHGGILFLGPVSTVRLRLRADGATALRLTDGVACTVAGARPIHIAVDTTDLLCEQRSGATLMRRSPAEVVCLRGDLQLRFDADRRFAVPVGEKLPAACANEPQTAPVPELELALDWYRELVYANCRTEEVVWERPGRSAPIEVAPETLCYLRLASGENGSVKVSFGGEPRAFKVRRDGGLELRLRLADLGPGPRLVVEPASAVRTARIFEATPR